MHIILIEWVDVEDTNWTMVLGVHAREEQSSEPILRTLGWYSELGLDPQKGCFCRHGQQHLLAMTGIPQCRGQGHYI